MKQIILVLLLCSCTVWAEGVVSPDPTRPLVNDETYMGDIGNVSIACFPEPCPKIGFYACDTAKVIYTTKENCDLCPERFWEAGRCVTQNTLMHAMHLESAYWNQKRCREENGTDCDKKGSTILDGVAREFYNCDTIKAVFSTKENCDLCSNREYKNHYCVLKESK